MKNIVIVLVIVVIVLGMLAVFIANGPTAIQNYAPIVQNATTTSPLIASTSPLTIKVTPKMTSIRTPSPVLPLIISGVYQVYYQNAGFYPTSIVVAAGTSVRFSNKSSKGLRILSAEAHPTLAQQGFDMSHTIGKGGVYDYTFTIPGIYSYVNQNNPKDAGTITVSSSAPIR